jgi:hypothetical protein
VAKINPQAVRLLRWFDSDHLPPLMQDIVIPVRLLAEEMAHVIEEGPELTAGLRKLLEAKDCFVRAAIEREEASGDAGS